MGRDQSLTAQEHPRVSCSQGLERNSQACSQPRPRTRVPWPVVGTCLQPTPQAATWCHPQLFPSPSNLIAGRQSTIHKIYQSLQTEQNPSAWPKRSPQPPLPAPQGHQTVFHQRDLLFPCPPPPPWPQCEWPRDLHSSSPLRAAPNCTGRFVSFQGLFPQYWSRSSWHQSRLGSYRGAPGEPRWVT